MQFKHWIQFSKELFDTIKEVPEDYIKSTGEYNSQYFSFKYDSLNDSCKFKMIRNSIPDPTPPPPQPQITITGGYISSTYIGNVQSSAASSELCQVSVTIKKGKLLDLKFIEKNNSGSMFTMLYGTDTYRNEDGGILVFSTLYLPENKMMVNGKLYDMVNSPDAFNEDVSNEYGVSMLDLYYLTEYFYGTNT